MPPELSCHLPCHPSSAATARQTLRHHFEGALGGARLSQLELVVTELVTNAVVHGDGAVTLKVMLDGETICGEVIDDGGGFERQVRRRGADEVGGRGLTIVEALSSRWGIHEGTTHVWFELRQDDDRVELTPPALGADQRPPEL